MCREAVNSSNMGYWLAKDLVAGKCIWQLTRFCKVAFMALDKMIQKVLVRKTDQLHAHTRSRKLTTENELGMWYCTVMMYKLCSMACHCLQGLCNFICCTFCEMQCCEVL